MSKCERHYYAMDGYCQLCGFDSAEESRWSFQDHLGNMFRASSAQSVYNQAFDDGVRLGSTTKLERAEVNEYTPTTEQVRDAYKFWNDPSWENRDLETMENYAEFDRWLQQHDAEIAKATEERIINVIYVKRRQLEQLVILSESEGSTEGKWFYEDRIKDLDNLLALIKGEQK